MRYCKPIFIMVFLCFSNSIMSPFKQEKQVIGCHITGGLFSNFLMVLCQLSACKKNNKIPVVYWDKNHSLYHDNDSDTHNAWEYYFEPVSSAMFNETDKINTSFSQEFFFTRISRSVRHKAFRLISKYIKIKPHIHNKVHEFYLRNMAGKKTIGIHLRGTDKCIEERLVDPKEIINSALKLADNSTQFFIACDEQKLFDQMRALLKDKNVIFYDCFRSDNGKPLHLRKPSPHQLGQDVLIEVLLLSKCDALVHTYSNVSTAALYFNPTLKNILVRHDWWG